MIVSRGYIYVILRVGKVQVEMSQNAEKTGAEFLLQFRLLIM